MSGKRSSWYRLFDSIGTHGVPVIITDDIELPFEDTVDYSNFCIFINSSLALIPGYVIDRLRNVIEEEWTQLWNQLLARRAPLRVPASDSKERLREYGVEGHRPEAPCNQPRNQQTASVCAEATRVPVPQIAMISRKYRKKCEI